MNRTVFSPLSGDTGSGRTIEILEKRTKITKNTLEKRTKYDVTPKCCRPTFWGHITNCLNPLKIVPNGTITDGHALRGGYGAAKQVVVDWGLFCCRSSGSSGY